MGLCTWCGRLSFGWVVVLAGITIHISLGILYSQGNMAPYIVSYTRERSLDLHREIVTLSVSPWLYGSATIVQGLSLALGGWLVKVIGTRPTALIGSLTLTGGVFLTAGSVMLSFWAVVMTFGVLMGLGMGITYVAPLHAAVQWLPKYRGVVIGLIVAGLGLSSFMFIPIQTVFINPKNLIPNHTPDEQIGFSYFTQPELLDRVPYSFIVLGGILLVIQLISIPFIVEPHETHPNAPTAPVTSWPCLRYLWATLRPTLPTSFSRHREKSNSEGSPEVRAGESHELLDQSANDSGASGDEMPREESAPKQEKSQPNVKPKELLLRWDFYLLWVAFAGVGEAVVYIVSVYKIFGQEFIFDDHSLAVVGAVAAVANCIGRFTWGIIADQVSYTTVLAIIAGGIAALTFTLYGTSVGKLPIYIIWIGLLFFWFGGVFSAFPTAVASRYGTEHFAANYGLFFTAQMFASVVAILISTLTHHYIRWFGQMIFAGSVSFVALILVIVVSCAKFGKKTTD